MQLDKHTVQPIRATDDSIELDGSHGQREVPDPRKWMGLGGQAVENHHSKSNSIVCLPFISP